jgi:hypothetical protein
VQSVFCAFIVKSNTVVSFHRTMAMKRRLENDEIERQLIFDSDWDCCI